MNDEKTKNERRKTKNEILVCDFPTSPTELQRAQRGKSDRNINLTCFASCNLLSCTWIKYCSGGGGIVSTSRWGCVKMRNQLEVGTTLPCRPHARNERKTLHNYLNISVLRTLRTIQEYRPYLLLFLHCTLPKRILTHPLIGANRWNSNGSTC